MRRREFLGILGAGAAWPLAAFAQQAKLARIGFVSWQSQAAEIQLKYLREGLAKFGYVEGQNASLDAYFTDGNSDRTRAAIRELTDKPIDVLIARVTPVAQLAKQATTTVPIVMIVADPIAVGLVPSLSRPGANLTGLSLASPDLSGKRLELIREIKPDVRTIAFLGLNEAQTPTFVRETTEAAAKLGLNLVVKVVDRPEQVDVVLFEAMKTDGVEAVIVQPLFSGQQDKIVELAMKVHLPVISDFAEFTRAGGLFSLGVEEADILRRAAYFVDRILKGAKPAELPIEQPTAFRLTLNARTAKTMGWTLSPVLLGRADEVIE